MHRGDVLAVLRSHGLLAATEGGDTARVTATSAPAASATVTPQQTPTQDRPRPRPADALKRLRKAHPQGDLSNRKYAELLHPMLVAESGDAWSLATLARRLSDKKQDPLAGC